MKSLEELEMAVKDFKNHASSYDRSLEVIAQILIEILREVREAKKIFKKP